MNLAAKSLIVDADFYYDLLHRCAACHCGDCAHKEWSGNSGRVYCRKIYSWRDADDFCKFADPQLSIYSVKREKRHKK